MSAESQPPGAGRKRLVVLIPVILFVALAGLFYVRLYAGDPGALPSALIGRQAPDAALKPIDGLLADGKPVPTFAKTDLVGGDVTVVNVFASWCAPCRQEHPLLMELKAQGVRLFGLNYKDDPENARRFLGGLGNPFDKVGADEAGRAAIEWGVYGVPETFVVAGDGRIAFKVVGPLSAELVQKVLLPEIEKAKAATPVAPQAAR